MVETTIHEPRTLKEHNQSLRIGDVLTGQEFRRMNRKNVLKESKMDYKKVMVFVDGEWDCEHILEPFRKHIEIYDLGEIHVIDKVNYGSFIDYLEDVKLYDCYLCLDEYRNEDWNGEIHYLFNPTVKDSFLAKNKTNEFYQFEWNEKDELYIYVEKGVKIKVNANDYIIVAV